MWGRRSVKSVRAATTCSGLAAVSACVMNFAIDPLRAMRRCGKDAPTPETDASPGSTRRRGTPCPRRWRREDRGRDDTTATWPGAARHGDDVPGLGVGDVPPLAV